jgi:pimeloyl-ACP methyl ester carboxylesterase
MTVNPSQSNDPLDPLQLYFPYLTQLYANYISTDLIIISLLFWLCLEVLFFALVEWMLLPRLRPRTSPLPYNINPIKLLNKILDEVQALKTYSNEDFVRGFFLGAEIHHIKRDNIRSFLSWVLFGFKEQELNEEQLLVITEAYEIVRNRLELSTEDGFNPQIKHVSISWDDISYIHRPLFLYVGNGLVDMLVTLFAFRLRGYRSFEMAGINYWYHPGTSYANKHMTPVVFFHGITPGWLGYFSLVNKLSHGRPVFLVELNSIKIKSMQFTMPTPANFAKSIRLMLKRHNYTSASLVGHSFGSITAGWFMKHHPEMVSHLTLIDPVSLLLCLPDVAYKFLYRTPRTIVEHIIYYFASSEVTISYALRRNFFWYRSVLWLDEVPDNVGVLVAVAGNDEITNAAAVYEYSMFHRAVRAEKKAYGIAPFDVVLFDKYSHGQVLLDHHAQNIIVKALDSNEKMLV